MKTALKDARKVVLEAKAPGREVLLGGHSLGASLTAAYAAWDFGGRAGARDVDGLVLIDGGLLGSFDAYDLKQAEQQIADLSESDPFFDLLEIGIPEAAGLFAEIGAMYAKLDPAGSAEALQNSPLVPAEFKPPVIATNRGLLGYALDRDTSPEELSLLHVNAGTLADAGDPRDWSDGGVTPLARLADTLGQEPSNAVEWYYPKRLSIDTNGANQMKRNDVARFLGLRLSHTRDIDVPIYAFQTDLTHGSVLAGARRWSSSPNAQVGVDAGQRRAAAEPPRSAHRIAVEERVPEDPGEFPRRIRVASRRVPIREPEFSLGNSGNRDGLRRREHRLERADAPVRTAEARAQLGRSRDLGPAVRAAHRLPLPDAGRDPALGHAAAHGAHRWLPAAHLHRLPRLRPRSFLASQLGQPLGRPAHGAARLQPFANWRHDHAVHHGSAGDLDRRGRATCRR